MKLDSNILVIGCGFFSQNIYLSILNFFFNKENIFVFDERNNLKKKVAKYFGYKYLENLTKINLKSKNIKVCFLCFDRSKSFSYSKHILKNKIHLFSEKPVCTNSQSLKLLIKLAKLNNLVFYGSFQRLFETKVQNYKNKFYKKKKILSKFYSGNFRFNKKTLVRTKEKLRIKNLKKKDDIAYHIFLNRYWHIFNTINYMSKFLKNKKTLKYEFIMYNLTSYKLLISNKNLLIDMILNSKKKIGWHESYHVNNEKKFKLMAPMKYSKSNISKTTFYKQIKHFIGLLRKNNYNNIENIYDELKFIEKIWKKKLIN